MPGRCPAARMTPAGHVQRPRSGRQWLLRCLDAGPCHPLLRPSPAAGGIGIIRRVAAPPPARRYHGRDWVGAGASIPSGSTPSIRTFSELRDRARPTHLDVGRANARLNDCPSVFIQAFVGGQTASPAPLLAEGEGAFELPCVSVPYIMASTSTGCTVTPKGVEFAAVDASNFTAAATNFKPSCAMRKQSGAIPLSASAAVCRGGVYDCRCLCIGFGGWVDHAPSPDEDVACPSGGVYRGWNCRWPRRGGGGLAVRMVHLMLAALHGPPPRLAPDQRGTGRRHRRISPGIRGWPPAACDPATNRSIFRRFVAITA